MEPLFKIKMQMPGVSGVGLGWRTVPGKFTREAAEAMAAKLTSGNLKGWLVRIETIAPRARRPARKLFAF